MRSWLNSIATAGNVTWLDGCPPTEANVYSGYNDYATEKGFLADGNFTASEQNTIKIVTQKSILNGIDVPKLKVGGMDNHIFNSEVSTVVQNYDTAYYHNVTDKMFLLDVKQLNKVYQNRTTLGTSYYVGKPTQKAVENSECKSTSLNIDDNWCSWNRTPYSYSGEPDFILRINSVGDINRITYAMNGWNGVRPAFYINLTSVIFKLGNGSIGSPYVADGPPTIAYNANGSTSGTAPNNIVYLEGTEVTVASICNLKKSRIYFCRLEYKC